MSSGTTWKCAHCDTDVDIRSFFCTNCGKSAVIPYHTKEAEELLDTIRRCILLINDMADEKPEDTLTDVSLLLTDAMIGRE